MRTLSASLILFALLTAGCSRPPAPVGEVELAPNPSGHVPLAALLRFETDRPARVHLSIDGGEQVTPSQAFTTKHEVPVLGAHPGSANEILVSIEGESGQTAVLDPIVFQTPELPDNFPPLEITTSRPARMEPGVTLLGLFYWPEPFSPADDYGLIVGLDAQGEVVWYYETDTSLDEPRPTARGTLLYTADRNGQLFEIDMLGNVLRRWHSTGVPKENIPADSIPVATDTFHHDVAEANGKILTFSTEVRRMPWPVSPAPDAEVEESNVIGDVLVEFDPASGEISRSWRFFDILDPQRRGFGSFTKDFYAQTYAQVLDEPGYDWTHSNSIFPIPGKDKVLLSSNYMCAVYQFDLSSGRIDWILGRPDGWREPWSDLLLQPVGDLTWFCGQHSAEITPAGTVLLFDNGNRSFPPNPPIPDAQDYSRAAEFRIDEQARTVEQVWSYGGPGEGRFLSPFISEADSLPRTGNVLVDLGGQMVDANGEPTRNFAAGRHRVTLTEVTHTKPPEKVWEVVIDDPASGWASFRAERVPSLYLGGS